MHEDKSAPEKVRAVEARLFAHGRAPASCLLQMLWSGEFGGVHIPPRKLSYPGNCRGGGCRGVLSGRSFPVYGAGGFHVLRSAFFLPSLGWLGRGGGQDNANDGLEETQVPSSSQASRRGGGRLCRERGDLQGGVGWETRCWGVSGYPPPTPLGGR